MRHQGFSRIVPLLVILAGIPMLLAGCQSTNTYFAGTRVAPELQVPLHSGETKRGVWQTFELTVHYTAEMGTDDLRLSGRGEFSQHYQLLYHQMRRFDLYLFLLDDASRVLKTVTLHPGVLLDTEDPIPFDRTVALPANTAGFSFGYSGKADSAEGDTDVFWELPRPD